MANVGTATLGKTLIGTGSGSSPTFASLGTGSGLITHGVVIAEGNSAFVATNAGTNGQVLLASTGNDPAFGTLTSSDSSITFTTGSNSLSLQVAGGTTTGKTITGNTGGALSPTAGNWNILTADSTVLFAGSGSTLTLDFTGANLVLGSSLPIVTSGTNNVGLGAGIMSLNTGASRNVGIGTSALQAINTGTDTVAVGYNAGNALTSAINNTLIGAGAGQVLTTGASNTAIGHSALASFTTGAANAGSNVAIGNAALQTLTTGVNNICIGSVVASTYTSSESSNILIGAAGTAAESNVLRIGTTGSSTGQQNKAFLAAVTGVTVAASAPVGVDTNGQLSSLGFGTSNQVFTSNGAATSPTWQSISSLGTITTITGNSGGAETPSSGNFNILGTGSITVAGTSNTETIQLTGLTNHTVLVGAGTATITKVGPGSSGQILQSGGASADPVYSTATYPSTAGTSGKILISNGTNIVSSTPTYPNASGTSGNVLTSDGTNFVSSALPSKSSDALVNVNTTIANVTGDGTFYGPIIFDTVNFDVGSNYSTITGLFTAPTTGKYLCCCSLSLQNLGVAHLNGEFRLLLNGATFSRSSFNPFAISSGGIFTYTFSLVIPATATNTLSFGTLVSGSTKTVGIQGNNFGVYSFASFTLIG